MSRSTRGAGPVLAWLGLVAALATLPGAPAAAQGVREDFRLDAAPPRDLTLREAVEIGLQGNPDVRSARFRFDATRAGLWEAYGNFLPQLRLSAGLQRSGGGQFVIGSVVIPTQTSYITFYQFDVTHRLFDAGRDLFRLEGARAERRAADAQIAADRLRTAGAIKRSYTAALAAAALRDQAEREIAGRRVRLDLAKARFELGSVTRSDVLQAQIAVSQAEVNRVNAERDMRTAKLDLLRSMGLQAEPDSVRLTERLEVFDPAFDADSLVRLALRDNPDLERLRAVQEQRESDNWIAKTAYLPTLQAAASFSSSVADSGQFQLQDFQHQSVYSLSLNWELFGGFARYNQTSRARAEVRAAGESLRAAELATEAAVRQAYLGLLAAYQTHLSKEQSVELARQELELAQERYRIGALSFPDLQDSQVTATAAETDYIRSAYDFFTALATLEEASAQSLFPGGAPAAVPR